MEEQMMCEKLTQATATQSHFYKHIRIHTTGQLEEIVQLDGKHTPFTGIWEPMGVRWLSG